MRYLPQKFRKCIAISSSKWRFWTFCILLPLAQSWRWCLCCLIFPRNPWFVGGGGRFGRLGLCVYELMSRPGGGILSDKFGRKKVLMILTAGLAVGYFAMGMVIPVGHWYWRWWLPCHVRSCASRWRGCVCSHSTHKTLNRTVCGHDRGVWYRQWSFDCAVDGVVPSLLRLRQTSWLALLLFFLEEPGKIVAMTDGTLAEIQVG